MLLLDYLLLSSKNKETMSQTITAAKLPNFLAPLTVGNMPTETPFYVTPDLLYLRNESNELFLDRTEEIADDAEAPEVLLGRVGLMSATIFDPETEQPITGYIADIRFADPRGFHPALPAEAPNDNEAAELYYKLIPYFIPLAAFAYTDNRVEEYETKTAGDVRFAQAALHLASLSDRLSLGKPADIERNTRVKERANADEASGEEETVVLGGPRFRDKVGATFEMLREVLDAKATERMIVRKMTKGLKGQVREQVAQQLLEAQQEQ
jgi:hypothetical protein